MAFAMRRNAKNCFVLPATDRVARLAVLDPREPDPGYLKTFSGHIDARNRSWFYAGP